MRKLTPLAVVLGAALVLSTGCSGPSYKLGRGLNNLSEPLRMGEMRRSIEQAGVWQGPDYAFSFGAIQGFNRTIVRTLIGAYEIATFPIPDPTAGAPSYDSIFAKNVLGAGDTYIPGPFRSDQLMSLDFMTADPKYPTNFRPGILSDSMFETDRSLGFSAGDVAPFIPGSRFHIFDY
jgi:putative exosortase-associated protein (TIGR04073 family)